MTSLMTFVLYHAGEVCFILSCDLRPQHAWWFAENWTAIQSHHFPTHKGTSFQSKLKDKWRVLIKGLRKKGATRSPLPEHLWAKVEKLSITYPAN